MNQKIIVKNYKGNYDSAFNSFQSDSINMLKEGYYPISQNYIQGSWGCSAFIIAGALSFFLIGIIAFIYMIIVKPDGVLSVTYELK